MVKLENGTMIDQDVKRITITLPASGHKTIGLLEEPFTLHFIDDFTEEELTILANMAYYIFKSHPNKDKRYKFNVSEYEEV